VRKRSQITSVVVIILLVIAIAAMLHYRGKVSVKLSPTDCNAELWKHVYKKERLRVVQECTAVEGRVVSMERSMDGDLHIGLDPDQKSVLNLLNVIHAHRELVVEIVCEHAPVKESARAACTNFRSQVIIPVVGNRIRVTGSYVTDGDLGWTEIHPVTRIEIIH
jgi:hypothetical protein